MNEIDETTAARELVSDLRQQVEALRDEVDRVVSDLNALRRTLGSAGPSDA